MLETTLLEDRRSELVAKGKRGEREKGDGKTRYEKRVKSRFASSTRSYNNIDMNNLFKNNILTIVVEVHGETADYEVKMKFGGFLDYLRRRLEQQNNKLDLRAITRALIDSFNDDDVYISCSCLHPDTRIKLLDGTTPTVAEMKDRFDKGEKLFVYSTDSNGDFKPGEVEKVWITNEANTNFIKVTLDNNAEIVTTPEHLFMLRDGDYIPAAELTAGQSLMPMYFSSSKGYEREQQLSSVDKTPYKVVKIEAFTSDPTPVYDIKVKKWENFVVDAGVVLHNCPDFFYRFGYWATITDINSGEPQLIPSDVTNPNNKLGPGCKHIMLVLANTGWLIKVASVINNYIKYFELHRQKQYADIIYPAIYGKKYEEPVQLSIDDKDTLDTDKDIVSRASEEGRVRGQFKVGNKWRFTPKNKVSKAQISFDDMKNNE